MGTDITCWAECLAGEVWTPCYQANSKNLWRFYPHGERNESLFTIFGAAPLAQGFEPIVPARGLPGDSPHVNELCADSAMQCWREFEASWLTLGELLDFPWHVKKRRLPGFVSGEEYMHYLTEGPAYLLGPLYESIRSAETWYQGDWSVSHNVTQGRRPPPHKTVTNAQMEQLLDEGANVSDTWTWIGCKEGDAYSDYATRFLEETMPLLARLGSPRGVRIVMFFH